MVQPTQTDPQFKLRLPANLKRRIEQNAKENNRSINAEIVSALEEAYPKPKPSLILKLGLRILLRKSFHKITRPALIDAAAEEGSKAKESIEELLSLVDVIEPEELEERIGDLEEVFERAILNLADSGLLMSVDEDDFAKSDVTQRDLEFVQEYSKHFIKTTQ